MKKLFTILAFILFIVSMWAQSPPQKMSYQAVLRNSSNALIVSTTVGMQISILQVDAMGGSAPVYVETQNPTTNINGLVSLEVGTGTVVLGTFSAIDWANGPFYIKVETDPAGGTSYSITGTSQLLSIPYAFYAKTAQNISGTLNEIDPVFVASPANGIVATQILNWNNKQSALTAGSGINITGTTISTTANSHYINEQYGGGIVFYVYDNGQHGLIASPVDQGSIQWHNGTARITNATGDGVGAGELNTAIIITMQTNDNLSGSFAAKICADLVITSGGVDYGDWYLPSKYELNLMYLQRTTIGAFNAGTYASSTDFNTISAWAQFFTDGSQGNYFKAGNFGVRAIRSF